MAACAEGSVDAVQVERGPPAGHGHRHLDDPPAQQRRHAEERHIGGGRQDDRAARAGEKGDRRFEALDHVGQGADLVRVHGPAGAGQPATPRRPRPSAAPRGGEIPKSCRAITSRSAASTSGAVPKSISATNAPHVRAGERPLQAAAAAQFSDGDPVERLGQCGHRGPARTGPRARAAARDDIPRPVPPPAPRGAGPRRRTRVAAHRDEVRVLARFDRPGPLVHAQRLGRPQGGCVRGSSRRAGRPRPAPQVLTRRRHAGSRRSPHRCQR